MLVPDAGAGCWWRRYAARLVQSTRQANALPVGASQAPQGGWQGSGEYRRALPRRLTAVEESNCVTGFNACFPLDCSRKVTHLPARPRKQLCQLVASEKKSVNSQL